MEDDFLNTYSIPPTDEDLSPITGEPSAFIPATEEILPDKVEIDPKVRDERAVKYAFAANDPENGSIEHYREAIETPGIIDQERERLARRKDMQEALLRNSIIMDMARQAASKGRKLTPQEEQVINDLSSEDIARLKTDPRTFFEKEYAERLTLKLQADRVNQVENDLDKYPSLTDVLKDTIARKEGFQAIYEDAKEYRKQRGYGEFASNIAQSMLPVYQWYKMSNLIKGAKSLSWLPGNNLKENIEHLSTLPADEAIIQARRAYDELRATNSLFADDFARALMSYTSSDAFWDNILVAGPDILSVTPVGKIIRGASTAAAMAATNKAIKGQFGDLHKAVTSVDSSVSHIMDANGNIAGAAGYSALKEAERRAKNIRGNNESWNDLMTRIPSIFNFSTVGKGSFNLSVQATKRLIEDGMDAANRIVQTFVLDPLTVRAFQTPEVLDAAASKALADLSKQYKFPEDAVLDITNVPVERALGGVLEAKVAIGKGSGLPFDTKKEAYAWGMRTGLPVKGSKIVKRGNGGYHIQVTRPLDLTSTEVGQAMILDLTNENRKLSNLLGRMLTPFRSADDVLPEGVTQARKTSVFAGARAAKELGALAEPILSLKKKDDLFRFTKAEAQMKRNPDDPQALTGDFSRSIGELEDRWMSVHKRMPTEKEVAAYFAYVRLNDLHYLTRNIDLFTEKTVRGIMNYKFDLHLVDESGNLASRVSAAKVEGRPVDRPPMNSEYPENTLFVGDEEAAFVFDPTRRGSSRNRTRLQEALDSNEYITIQVSEFGSEALNGIEELRPLLNNRHINYVVVKKSTSEPLDFRQIPYVGGGRRIYPDGGYVSVPSVARSSDGGRGVYYGDKNLFRTPDVETARDFANRLNHARSELIRITGHDGRSSFINRDAVRGPEMKQLADWVRDNLAIDWREFRRLYVGPRATHDVRNPVLWRDSNKSTFSTHNLGQQMNIPGGVINYSDSPHNPYRSWVNMDYAKERGDLIREVTRSGDPQSPTFGIGPAQTLDPIPAMEQVLQSVLRGRGYNQMRMESAQRFVAEYGELLDISAERLRADPFEAMMNAPFKEGSLDAMQVRQAKAFRSRMAQFLGVRTEEEAMWHRFISKSLDGISPYFGQGWGKNFYEAMRETDPVTSLRSIAFHAKIGLWNPLQLMLQGQTWAHVIALAGPTIGTKAGLISMWQNVILNNPDKLLNMGSEWFQKMGFGSKQEFLEASYALKRSGYDSVGREVAIREHHMSQNILSVKGERFFNDGLRFFNQGEAFVRRTSFNAAYMEWRQANPVKKLTDLDIAGILNRADLMNVNMTQASNAVWQKGWISIPTQFWSYNVRMLEQLLGKRLTGMEKARVLGTYGALYGLPVSAQMMSIQLPVYDNVRSYLMDKGIDTDPGTIAGLLHDGVLGTIVNMAAQEQTSFTQRYGPMPSPWIYDILSGNKSTIETLTGASGSVVIGVLEDTAPVIPWLLSAVTPGAPTKTPVMKDFTDVFTNIQYGSIMEKMFIAMNTGHYLTKDGNVIDTGNQAGIRSMMYAIFGLSPRRIQDMYILMRDEKSRRKAQRDLTNRAQQEMAAALKSGNIEDMMAAQKRISIYLGQPTFTPVEQMNAMSKIFKSEAPMIERAIDRMKHNPKLQEQLRLQLRRDRGIE